MLEEDFHAKLGAGGYQAVAEQKEIEGVWYFNHQDHGKDAVPEGLADIDNIAVIGGQFFRDASHDAYLIIAHDGDDSFFHRMKPP